jgi:hypothetical protein
MCFEDRMSLVISLAMYSLMASYISIEIKRSDDFPFEETITITRLTEDMIKERDDEDDDC